LKRIFSGFRVWILSLLACAVVVAVSFARIDVPTALYFWSAGRALNPLSGAFGARIILSGESAVVLTIVVGRLARGHASAFGKTLTIACLTSMCAYVINDHVLKVLFGVPGPIDLIQGVRHEFNFLTGPESSSFPSGHMVLAGAFAGVFMRLYRVSIWPLSALLLFAAGLLVVGGWHFVSDIVAGAFLGTSAGVLAGEAWAVHSAR
jgi:membrane-associated phospholipid phosphatase